MVASTAGLLDDLAAKGLRLPTGARVVGVGWATVDLERAAATLATALATPAPGGVDISSATAAGAFRPAPDDDALGGRCRRADADDIAIVILEPRTEGRLAAALARHGEGPVAVWVIEAAPIDRQQGAGAATAQAERLAPTADPLGGRSRLVRPTYPWGPFLLYHQPMTTGPTIRAATDADAEAIATLFTDEGYPAGPSDIRERLSRFDSAYSTVRVAELGGELVGFVAVHVMPRFEHGDRIARVLALIVDAGVRERGVGHLLMSAAEDVARETDCAFIEVTAGRHRPEAQRLYESIGYEAGIANYLRKRI